MLDSQIVAAIAAGDPDGLAAAYDRYAAPLYAFCHSLLNDQADAADVVQDTFIIASVKLDGLKDPELLKSWLFAVARNECHRRLRARTGDAFGIVTGEVSDDTIDFGIDLERAQLTEVVSAALAALPLARREIIELSLRQDFDSDDLGSTLGVSPNQAQVFASQARGQFEESVAALLVTHSGGRLYCDELDEMLDGQDARLTAAACQRLVQHARHCRICSKRVRRDLQPATLLAVLPATEIARGLRQQVLSVAASDAPDVVAYRADVVRGAEPFDEASGFPAPVDQPRRERKNRPAVLALVAAAVFAALCAVVLEFGLHHLHRQPQLTAAPVGGQLASPQAQGASSSSGQAPGQHSSTSAPPGSLTAATPGISPTLSGSGPPPPGIIRPLGSRLPSTPPAVSPPPSTSPTTPPTTPVTTPPSTPPTTTPPTTTPPTTTPPTTTPPTTTPPTTTPPTTTPPTTTPPTTPS